MFKDSKDGQTNFCSHYTKDNGICDECLGKPKEEMTAKEYLTDLLIETDGYDAIDRKRLKNDLSALRKDI